MKTTRYFESLLQADRDGLLTSAQAARYDKHLMDLDRGDMVKIHGRFREVVRTETNGHTVRIHFVAADGPYIDINHVKAMRRLHPSEVNAG